jgi:xanthine dehydrogenase accessory factor
MPLSELRVRKGEVVRVKRLKIVIKGAGEMASGIAHRLHRAHIGNIVMTDMERPLCVRRAVSFCEALFEKTFVVEGITAEGVSGPDGVEAAWARENIAVIVDPTWTIIQSIRPDVVVDAIMAKKPTGTRRDEASFVIGVGPGFSAPENVHVIVESNRGHDLGRLIYSGQAEPYTGMPGLTAGYSRERVIRSPHAGTVKHVRSLGDSVEKGEVILYVDKTPVHAAIPGVVRGLIREIEVWENEKLGDIEPRGESVDWHRISDKARAIGGGALEAIMHEFNG